MKAILERLDRMDDTLQRVGGNVQRLEGTIEQLGGNVQRLEGNVQRLDNKWDTRIQRLEEKMDAGFQKQGAQLESLQGDVKQALEGISGNRKVLDDKFAEVLNRLDERVQPVELASRHFAREIAALGPRPRTKRKKASRS